MDCLIETALLTHGLRSVANKEIRKIWTDNTENIAWVSEGEIVIGGIESYLEFRTRAPELIRIDCNLLEAALTENLSGALTASGTMKVCQRLGIPMAVTCGMGGIGDIRGEELCPDLPALAELPVSLVSTGPKDMLDREKTISWLTGHGVAVLGAEREYCTGYIFPGDKVMLQGIYKDGSVWPPCLIIHEIAEDKRIQDRRILETAVRAGKRAEQEGRYYHPAVNGKIDELTAGYSSGLQLESLYRNALFAKKIDF